MAEKDILIPILNNTDHKPDALTFEVKHDPYGQKFFIELKNCEAVIAYTQVNDILDLHHTVVPEEYSGRGFAEKMCTFAFEFAKENKLKIIPTCPYIAEKFLPKHPEYNGLITSY
jgi:predicted GNAT family acetyltransferase